MRSMSLSSMAWLVAGIMVVSVGCGSGKPKAVPTEAVEGLVTLDGQPVPEATVTFQPVQEGLGASATGLTDAEGKYRLTAIGAGARAEPGAGTLPGEYYVGVMKVSVPDVPTDEEQQAALGPDAVPSGERPKNPQMTYVVPQKFSDPRSSGIKVTVKAGKNDIPIPLNSK